MVHYFSYLLLCIMYFLVFFGGGSVFCNFVFVICIMSLYLIILFYISIIICSLNYFISVLVILINLCYHSNSHIFCHLFIFYLFWLYFNKKGNVFFIQINYISVVIVKK